MTRPPSIDPGHATGTARDMLDELASRGGLPGPMIQGMATDPKVAAMVAFGQQVIGAPAEVSDQQLEALRVHGFSDEPIAEVVASVALQLLTGALDLVAGIRPAAPPGRPGS